MAEITSNPTLTSLISSYPILTTLASQVSTLDLFHLALTNRTYFSHILASRPIFAKLRQQCLCDGHGLAARQNAKVDDFAYDCGTEREIFDDEPIEVRLWNVKCDAAMALPCRKCGINVCEECRSYERIQYPSSYSSRRPHLNGPWQSENVMCFCKKCDAEKEEELRGRFLNELCDCDSVTRWICEKCVRDERRFTREYYRQHTEFEGGYAPRNDLDNDDYPQQITKIMMDHQHSRAFWCICGATVPEETVPRCTWCERRHLPQSEWFQEARNLQINMSKSAIDPDYPYWVTDSHGNYPFPYPKLGYSRPSDTGVALIVAGSSSSSGFISARELLDRSEEGSAEG